MTNERDGDTLSVVVDQPAMSAVGMKTKDGHEVIAVIEKRGPNGVVRRVQVRPAGPSDEVNEETLKDDVRAMLTSIARSRRRPRRHALSANDVVELVRGLRTIFRKNEFMPRAIVELFEDVDDDDQRIWVTPGTPAEAQVMRLVLKLCGRSTSKPPNPHELGTNLAYVVPMPGDDQEGRRVVDDGRRQLSLVRKVSRLGCVYRVVAQGRGARGAHD